MHVDDSRQSARRAVGVAGDGGFVVAAIAPEAGGVAAAAAAAADDCVAAEVEELGDYFARGVHVE